MYVFSIIVSTFNSLFYKIFQLQERNLLTNHRRDETSDGELDDGFSTSSMSGFSYRDSLESHGASEEEIPTTITFGVEQSEALGVFHDYPASTVTPREIKQGENCPLLPNRKNYELKRELIRDMEIVGEGAFGLVAKAILFHTENSLSTVAVKMLKGNLLVNVDDIFQLKWFSG
jgi:hypothetical protein